MEVNEPIWVSRFVVDIIHREQLREHGGRQGLGNENALESAISRARNKWHYDAEVSIEMLAAAYCYALSRNHAYIDGNKRTGFLTMVTFLGLNGYEFTAPEEEVVEIVRATASGDMKEEDLAKWIGGHMSPSNRFTP